MFAKKYQQIQYVFCYCCIYYVLLCCSIQRTLALQTEQVNKNEEKSSETFNLVKRENSNSNLHVYTLPKTQFESFKPITITKIPTTTITPEAPAPATTYRITDVRVLYCESEPFQHFYVLGYNKTPHNNAWKRTSAGESGTLQDVCLFINGLSLTRRCLYDSANRQAVWENITNWKNIECLKETTQKTISQQLNALHTQVLGGWHLHGGPEIRRNIMQQVLDLMATPKLTLLPADIHFITQILKELVVGEHDIQLSRVVLSVCDLLMKSDKRILRLSSTHNITNSLLETFENYMNDLATDLVPNQQCDVNLDVTVTAVDSSATTPDSRSENTVQYIDLSHLGVYAELSPNISVFHVNPECNQISGIAIYDADTQSNSRKLYEWQYKDSFKFAFIYTNETIENLSQEQNLQVATFIPKSLWQMLRNDLLKKQVLATLVIKVYANDAFFVENTTLLTRKPIGKVLSISIPNYSAPLPAPLPFILSMEKSVVTNGSGCAYWNYSTWVNSGVHTHTEGTHKMLLCTTDHLTQFSYLLGGTYRQYDIDNEVLITPVLETALDIISLVGCALSLLGLIGIWLSAAVLRNWRTLASTKILLNMCLALTFQMVLILFVNTNDITEQLIRDGETTTCILIGAALQYATLVLFVWMLIVAVLQFQRYVTVIGIKRPEHYILKAALAAWLIPLLPTLLLAFISPSSYLPSELALQTNSATCYPTGLGLILGVVTPVVSIVAANTVIFVYVLYSVSHTLSQTLQRVEKQLIMKQLRLSVLLFFLLGLSWIFGILSFMNMGIIFSYAFCLTATLQGFVMFIYFIILDKVPRQAWLQVLCSESYFKKKFDRRAPELMSMATTSTSLRTSQAAH